MGARGQWNNRRHPRASNSPRYFNGARLVFRPRPRANWSDAGVRICGELGASRDSWTDLPNRRISILEDGHRLACLSRKNARKRSEGGELDQWKCRCELSVGLVESRFKIYSRKRIAPVAAINGDLIEASFNPSFSLGIE